MSNRVHNRTQEEPHQLVEQAKRRATKIRPKAGGIFARFSNFDVCRPDVADDVISGFVLTSSQRMFGHNLVILG